ncbi:response regulator transcription factor [Defluviimonas sp. WL0075]|uniref:Response regulator transcription factor n=1 Tax=Albidovulum sediminicola TaxID=2984331 RepID=A0ABT2Z1M5_9RHOB|nr:response regulator transcription factor [Defluviimonas sp. WL0075]MCV2865048.1 response regulator transcription factor [Defluviimonas sp. WL0075]
MKIIIADDHALVLETLAAFIAGHDDMDVRAASDLEAALGLIATEGTFDCVLLDYNMPGMNGLEGLERVIAANRDGAVALMSGNVSRHTVEAAIASGASGFVPKTLSAKSLVQAIRFMAAGEVYAPFDFMTQENQAGSDIFSPRELSVLRCVCDGKPNKIIALELGVQEVTIKAHVKSICRKLDANNRTHAAMIARDRGLFAF